MHQLAIALASNENIVSGSDIVFEEPIRERLSTAGIFPEKAGWFPDKITANIDRVVLSMNVAKDNPERLQAQKLGLNIVSYPELIYELSKDKKRIIVAGSHGKTTVVAMAMHCLKRQKIDFDYVVGAKIEGFDTQVRLSNAPIIIIEADDYPSSPIDPRPKMLHYRPHVAVVTGIAWSHINAFPTMDQYRAQYDELIDTLEPEANLIWNQKEPELQQLLARNKDKNHFYSVPFEAFPAIVQKGKMTLKMWGKPKVPVQAFGEHNLANAKAAFMLCREMGIWIEEFMKDLAHFNAIPARLQVLTERNDFIAWQDSAHSPTQAKATVQAIKQLYPERRLVACYELANYSNLHPDYLPTYKNTLELADKTYILYSPAVVEAKKLPKLSIEMVENAFCHTNLQVFDRMDDLKNTLQKEHWADANLIFMSSSNFEGLDLQQFLRI